MKERENLFFCLVDVQGDALSSFCNVCSGLHTAGINWEEGKELLGCSHVILHTTNCTYLPTTAGINWGR